MTYIKRNIDKIIEDWFNSDKRALMILGARQIGKSESAKEFLRNLYKINNDSLLPILDIENTPGVKDAIISGKSEGGQSFIRNLFANIRSNADLDVCKVILIDEVQALSNSKKLTAEKEIKDILSRLMNETEFRFIFSGSLLGSKISNLEEFTKDLPGGIIQIHMHPISFAEFVEYIDGNNQRIESAKRELIESKTISKETHIHLLKRFGEYSFVGGMPKSLLAYSNGNKYSVMDSMDAISTLKEDYIQDTQKYYKEELGIDVGNGIFDWLLFGINKNDKKKLMKRLKQEPEKTLYQYIIDSDIGLLVSHVDEFKLTLNQQEKPKTFFNDVGFMRLMIRNHLEGIQKYDDVPRQLKDYFDYKRNLDDIKQDYFKYIENDNNGSIFPGAGRIFEQLVAQGIKEKGFTYAYDYSNKPQMELEFVLPKDGSAIEVKSGGFDDFISSSNYAEEGNKVYFLSLLPYVGETLKNITLLPVYALSLLNEEELSGIVFKSTDSRVKEILISGKLPKTRGFYIKDIV